MWQGWSRVGLPSEQQVEQSKTRRLKANDPKLGAFERANTRKQRIDSIRKRMADALKVEVPRLYYGEKDVELNDSEVESLSDAVCDGLVGQELRTAHNLLMKGLERGVQQLGWKLNPKSTVSVLSMEASAITSSSQELCRRFNELNQTFFEDLKNRNSQDVVQSDIALSAGQLLVSLIMHSGCHCTKIVEQLPNAIRRGVHVHDDQFWLECEGDEVTGSESRNGAVIEPQNIEARNNRPDRRVFPVASTGLLLLRYYRRHGRRWPGESVKDLVASYLDHIEFDQGVGGSPLRRVIELSRARTATLLPGVLRTYAERAQVSPPISTVNMVRLVTNARRQSDIDDESQKLRVLPHEPVKKNSVCRDLSASLSRLRAELRPYNANRVREAAKIRVQLRGFLDECTDLHPLIVFLVDWANHLLSHGNLRGAPLKVSSTQDYIQTVSKALMPYASMLAEPEVLEGEQWEEIYEMAVESSSAAKLDVATKLGYFHRYLERAFEYPEAEIDGASGAGGVDAALVTPDEYIQAYDTLLGKSESDLSRMSTIALVLGFRCGLRRSEALGLQLKDFVGFDTNVERVELLVQRNGFRGLKSFSATRRLPLWLLLTEEELNLVRLFRERRKNQCSDDLKKPFFDVPGNTRRVLVETMVMRPVTRTLKYVTGDQSARFHHLRHSFASLTFLRMLEFEPLQYVPSIYRTDMAVRYFACVEQVLWRKAGLTDTLSRIYLLSAWLGHSSPSVTMQTYVHLADWVLALRLADINDVSFTQVMQSTITGMTPSATEKHNQRKRIREPKAAAVMRTMMALWPREHRSELAVRHLTQSLAYEFDPYFEHIEKPHWLMPYQVEATLEEKADLDDLRLDDFVRVADIMGLCEHTVAKIHWNAVELASRTYDGRERAKGEQRSRFFTTDKLTKRPLADKRTDKGLRQQRYFIAPPPGRSVRRYSERFFDQLVQWYEEDSSTASHAIREHLMGGQRTHSNVRHRKIPQKQSMLHLLNAIGAKSWVRIEVRVTENNKYSDRELRQYHSQFLGLDAKNITICRPADRQGRYDGEYGVWLVDVQPPDELVHARSRKGGENKQFWAALRFAVFSAGVYLLDPKELGASSEEVSVQNPSL